MVDLWKPPKPNLYVGCSLTHAPEPFKEEVEATKTALSARWRVMQFLGLSAGTPKDVYRVDILQNVGSCDAFIGIVDDPSWGLGYESAKADARGVPVMLAAHKDSHITRLALGTPDWMSNVVFVEYEDMAVDIPKLAEVHLLPAVPPPHPEFTFR